MDDGSAGRVLAIFFLFRLFGSAEREVEVNIGSHRTRELPGLTFPRLFLYLALPSFPKKDDDESVFFLESWEVEKRFRGFWGRRRGEAGEQLEWNGKVGDGMFMV